jgi:hypothetical protein
MFEFITGQLGSDDLQEHQNYTNKTLKFSFFEEFIHDKSHKNP